MYWVTILMVRVEVKVYGADSPDGPWDLVWTPFLEPNAHFPRWRPIELVETTLSQGHEYYKLEVHGLSPPDDGGAMKVTGLYFSARKPDILTQADSSWAEYK